MSFARAAWELFAVVVIAAISITILLLFLRESNYIKGSIEVYVELVIVIVVAVVIIRFVGQALSTFVVPRASPAAGSALRVVFNILAYLALIFVVFDYLGINITAALVGAGFLGIVLGLAAQTALGNILAALAILGSHPFTVGEYVTVVSGSFPLQWDTFAHEEKPVGFTGRVREIGLIYSEIEGPDGIPLFFSNGSLITAMIINHSRGAVRQVRVRQSVPRKVSPAQYRAQVEKALQALPEVVPGSVQIRVLSIAETSYDAAVIVGLPAEHAEHARSRVLERLLELDLPPKGS
jgi:small-conductance mechanosensitive channel